MKKQKIFFYVIFVIISLAVVTTGWSQINSCATESGGHYYISFMTDNHAYDLLIYKGGVPNKFFIPFLSDDVIKLPRHGSEEYEIGEIIWQYFITAGSDNSIKAIAPIADINNDGIDDVVVCSEDYYIRCFDGGALGTGVVLWEHFIYSGKLYCQNELTIRDDVDNDGYQDVVVGTPWGDRSVHTLSGKTGDEIWVFDTHEGGDGGWVYQVDCSYDYNNDDVMDVLAVAGGTASGSRKAYCLDGEDGTKIWDCPLGSPKGPGFSIIGIEDFSGDGQADVLAGASNSIETVGYTYGINGATGSIIWSFTTGGSSVWALEQIDDITGDGIKDVIIGDFNGNIYGLDATTGGMEYSNSLGSAVITRFAKLNDVNGDDHPDIVPAHSTVDITQVIDGYNGNIIWSHAVADQPWNVARIADVSGDAIDDVLVGTLYNSNYCYFLDGVDGTELKAISYVEAVDAIAAIPDVVADGSMEMIAGGRNGKLTCYSGGLNASTNPIRLEANFTASPRFGGTPLMVNFSDTSIAENTTITQWEWDFDNDGGIDSTAQHPSWTYDRKGQYSVSLHISDGKKNDIETKTNYITVVESSLKIESIAGGLFKIKTNINNNGEIKLEDISWEITLSGGVILLGRSTTGLIPSIEVNETKNISSNLILGLGQISIYVTAETKLGVSNERTISALLLLFYINVPPGGG